MNFFKNKKQKKKKTPIKTKRKSVMHNVSSVRGTDQILNSGVSWWLTLEARDKKKKKEKKWDSTEKLRPLYASQNSTEKLRPLSTHNRRTVQGSSALSAHHRRTVLRSSAPPWTS